MRVMVDTNVLLSSLVFSSTNATGVILSACSGGNVLLLSTFCIDEACAVIARKWPDRIRALEDMLLGLLFETVVTPLNPRPGLFEIRDSCDYPALYSAIVGAADLFVTGDKDFTGVHVDGLSILTLSECMNVFGRK